MSFVESARARIFSPDDATVDATTDSSNSDQCLSPECRVHLVEGSGTHLSGETEHLLRSRLRSAALLFFAGFASFFVWHTTQITLEAARPLAIYAAHFICTLILAAIACSLCTRCPITTRQLRWIEFVTFGVPVAFFLLMQHEKITLWAGTYRALPDIGPFWFLTIFTYALFIPNTWQRAAIAIGLIAAAPLIAIVATAVFEPSAGAILLADPHVLVESFLSLSIAVAAAVLGVHTINSLRSEAYRAKQLGQYKLKRLIGSGGMGDVYLAEHLLMKRPCAIKVIRPEKAGDPKVLARFEREVQATARLSHWNTVDIFDYGRADDGTFYYVMEFLPGMNLSELVRRYGPMPASRALHLGRQACDALQEAHALGLIHRDIKPANIFSAVRGGVFDVAKILDFGLAKPLADVAATQITQEGAITGSPYYMSPEQALGDREPDARTDIYALGGVLYFLVTGRPPFDDDNPMKVLIAHAHEPPPPPSRYNPDIPEDLELVIMRCLQKTADDRYQSAADLTAALENCDDFGRWTRDDARSWWQANGSSQPISAGEVAV
jgi:serine/threonine-protein kinase